jgi:deoxyribonuclease-4
MPTPRPKAPAVPLDLGCHLSIAKGLPATFDSARKVDATCVQVFTRNPRGSSQREVDDAEIATAKTRRAAAGVRTLVAHIPYTVNLASPRAHAWDFARQVLHADLRAADRMGAQFVVVHPGTHVGDGLDAGLLRIVDAVGHALEGYDGAALLLLEGMAGGGSCIGGTPEELARILDGLHGDPRVGVCLDSCHLFAAGWDLRTPAGVDACLAAFDAAVGLDRVRCLHLNDSLKPLGSHLDRHARIGKGELGEAGIRSVVTHPFLSRLPMCLETPVDDWPDFAEEIRAVRELARVE